MTVRTPEDASTIETYRTSAAYGTASPSQLAAAYGIVDRGPSDDSDDDIVAAAIDAGMVQEAHLETASDIALAEAPSADAGPRRSRHHEVTFRTICPRYGNQIVNYRKERLEHLLVWLADGPDTFFTDYGHFRRKAVRDGLIVRTGRTAGIAKPNGGVDWYYELTAKGREVLAAYDAEMAAAAPTVSA